MVGTEFVAVGMGIGDKQEEEAKMIHVVIDQTWRYQYELVFNLLQLQIDTDRNVYSYVSTHSIHTFLTLYLRRPKNNNTLEKKIKSTSSI